MLKHFAQLGKSLVDVLASYKHFAALRLFPTDSFTRSEFITALTISAST